MTRKRWILICLSLVMVAMLAVPMATGVGAQGTVTMNVTTGTGPNGTTVKISFTNELGRQLDWVQIVVPLNEGVNYVSSNPEAKVENGQVMWFQTNVPDEASVSGFEVVLSGTGLAQPRLSWKAGALSGTATAERSTNVATGGQLGEPLRRGCLACHVPRMASGAYSLAYEAAERAEASRGIEHPTVAPDGTSMKPTDKNNVQTCLLCHRQGAQGALPLSDIVHPAHMASETFVEHYTGTCWTCHTVGPLGTLQIINDSIAVNDKGIQKSLGPIPTVPPTIDLNVLQQSLSAAGMPAGAMQSLIQLLGPMMGMGR